MYEPINGWTKETIIAQIVKRNNGTRSTTPGHVGYASCAYRGEGSNACAAGCFIPDELYKKTFEGRSIGSLLKNYPAIAEVMPLRAEGMNDFQGSHDNSEPDNARASMLDWVNKNVSGPVTSLVSGT